MSNTYLVNWDGEGSEDAQEFKCDSAEEAYNEFLKENGMADVMVCIWSKDDGDYYEFSSHIQNLNSNGVLEIEKQVETERELQAERQLQAERHQAERHQTLDLAKKIKEAGFNQLSLKEINMISTIVDRSVLSDSLSEEDFKLIKSTLADDDAYKFFTLRSNARFTLQQSALLKAMNVNLSDISDKSGGIKMASMLTGMVAAKHLGEELAGEDESEEMDFGGFD